MKYRLSRLRGQKLLVARPRENTFGHQVLELLMGLHMAASQQAALLIVRPRRAANAALFDVTCREVLIVRGVRRRAALAAGAVRHVASALGPDGAAVRWLARRHFDLLSYAAERFPRLRPARKRAKARLAHVSPDAAAPTYFGLDFRDRYARHPFTLALPPPVVAAADRAAERLGIGSGARIAILHVRESGFKQAHGGEGAADAIRNADIESYEPAIDWLVSRGFCVVRIGDRWMRPIARRGVIDLATAAARTDALELRLCFRSALFIGCDSGPHCVALLTNTPCLTVNVTNVLGGYPVRAVDRYLLKHVHDRTVGRQLALGELLTQEYFDQRKDLERYTFADNTPAELVEAVVEMVDDVLDARAEPSAGQRLFHDLADRLYNSPAVGERRTRKGEPRQQLLGEGFIGRRFAERYLHAVELAC